MAYVIVG